MSSPTQVWEYRTLVSNLALRDLRSKYKKSFLGWAWSLINPAVNLGTYTVVFGLFLGGVAPYTGRGGHQVFALWLFSALVVWNAFAGGVNTSMGAMLGAGHMLTRSYFPPECPVLAGNLTVLLQTTLETTILLVFMAAIGNVGWTFVFVVPIVIMVTMVGMGLGMVVSLLNVRYRDVGYLVGIGLQLGFYATPIVYRLDLVGDKELAGIPVRSILVLNPMTHFVGAMRKATYQLQVPTLTNIAVMAGSALVCMGIGWWYFDRTAPRYIEEI